MRREDENYQQNISTIKNEIFTNTDSDNPGLTRIITELAYELIGEERLTQPTSKFEVTNEELQIIRDFCIFATMIQTFNLEDHVDAIAYNENLTPFEEGISEFILKYYLMLGRYGYQNVTEVFSSDDEQESKRRQRIKETIEQKVGVPTLGDEANVADYDQFFNWLQTYLLSTTIGNMRRHIDYYDKKAAQLEQAA